MIYLNSLRKLTASVEKSETWNMKSWLVPLSVKLFSFLTLIHGFSYFLSLMDIMGLWSTSIFTQTNFFLENLNSVIF